MSEELFQRLEGLQRASRRWKSIGMASVVTAVLMLAGGWGMPQERPERKSTARVPEAVEVSDIPTTYANYCRVSGTPEELALDFGLNLRVNAQAGEAVKLTHRVVMSYYTAKRLTAALQAAVRQHENSYGPLELDLQKRMRNRRPAEPEGNGRDVPTQ
jgi:hypothetical protein